MECWRSISTETDSDLSSLNFEAGIKLKLVVAVVGNLFFQKCYYGCSWGTLILLKLLGDRG